jgi:hypothetical protein
MRYVLGEHGILADLGVEGALARHLREVLARPADACATRHRWDSVRRRFDWGALAPDYRRMFAHAAQAPLPSAAAAGSSARHAIGAA